jgi:adenosylcobinamide-GDP ribazoletransferase
MFCAIPLPFHLWDDNCLDFVLVCFPLIGGLVGVLWWGIAKVLLFSGIHILLASAVITLIPGIVTGFLHLDGYMDTSDAVLSRRPLEDKLRILKDPHTGSFAVIMLAVLFVLQFSAVFAVFQGKKRLALLIVIPIISRCCSAMSVLSLKVMEQSGFANMFRQNTGLLHKIFILFTAALAFVLSYFFNGIYGLIVAASVFVGFTGAMAYAYSDLKGVSGDLAGYALVIGELCGLIVMAVL